MTTEAAPKIYVVEHLDSELGPWSSIEYRCIARECGDAGAQFNLTSVSEQLASLPSELQELEDASNFRAETRSVEELFADKKHRVCLLDPAAAVELEPADGDAFDVFVFGGILGDDPPQDRTRILRDKGFITRRLGPKQMSTDTAVRVTRTIVQDKVPLDKIPYIDSPELRFSAHETTELPYRYVRNDKGEPVMPEGMAELIKSDPDRSLSDLL